MGNTEFRIEPYKPSDFFSIVRRAYELQTMFELPNPDHVARLFASGPAYTGYANDRMVAAAGIIILWDGVGEAWALTSPLVHKYPLFFTKTIRDYLEDLIVKYNLVRVQAVVQKDYEMANRWIRIFGFKPEGEMPKYRAGKTFIRYARIMGG